MLFLSGLQKSVLCRHARHFTGDLAHVSHCRPDTVAFAGYEDEYTALRRTLDELNASLDEQQPPPYPEHTSQSALRRHAHSSSNDLQLPQHIQSDPLNPDHQYSDRFWYKQDAVLQDRTNPRLHHQASHTQTDRPWCKEDAVLQDKTNPRLDQKPSHAHLDRHNSSAAQPSLHQEHSHAPSDRRQGSRRHSAPEPSLLGSGSLRTLPVLNNSFIVPAPAAKPKKVDRVARHK